jgi:hypothetical protein
MATPGGHCDATQEVDVQLSRVIRGIANGGLPLAALLLLSDISELHLPCTADSATCVIRHLCENSLGLYCPPHWG